MKAALAKFYGDYKYGLPFLVLLIASLFLSSAPLRIVFYILTPFLLVLLYRNWGGVKKLFHTNSFLILAAYLGYFFLSFFWSADQDAESFFRLLRNVSGIFIFSLSLAYIIPKIPRDPRLPLYFAGMCVAYAVLSSLVFYDDHVLKERLFGLGRYQNSIHFSFLMSFGILAVACLGLKGRWKDILLRFALVLALLFFIALAQTRSAYVGLALCIALLTVLGHARYALVLCIFGVVCAAVAYVIWDNSFIDMGQRLDGFRFQIWTEALKGIIAHPLFGSGIITDPSFLPENQHSKGGWESTHSVYLGHAYIGGITGFLIFVLMISNMAWICFSRWWRERKEQNVRYMTLLACLILCFSLTSGLFVFTTYVVNVHIHWLVFWAPFAVLWSMEAQDRERLYA